MQIPGDPHSGPDGTVDDLAGLRAALDEVDFRLLDAVRDRVELCRRVGAVKARTDVPVVQPGRMDLVHRRAREYAEDNGLSTAFVDRLFDLLIDEACRVEDTVTGTGSRPREDGGPR
ncbi:chorismate mutase family protein [Rhodococcus triatomae]|nr:chorismate mutase family protein [Rhodococcus triatomae]QNG25825.1 chorismate mutase family protein [Rhodococcus triatomae]